MKRSLPLALGLTLLAPAFTFLSAPAAAQLSANIGWASEYYFRGIKQKTSSASAGVDYESAGFYLGSWAADVGDGLEVDGYLGYGIETEQGLSASVGFTGYYYTGEFDDTYEELNLNLGYGVFGLEYSVGTWDGFGSPQDYDFLALSVGLDNGWYGILGAFGDQFDGEYLELGWGTSLADIDIGIAGLFSSKELSDQFDSDGNPDESQALIFTIGKSW